MAAECLHPTVPHLAPQRVLEAVQASIPCLLVGGSGGVADCLAQVLAETQPGEPVRALAQEKMQDRFPPNDLLHLAEQVLKLGTQVSGQVGVWRDGHRALGIRVNKGAWGDPGVLKS